MKRFFLSFLVLVLSLSLMVACSSNEETTSGEDKVQEITVWTWPNNDQTFNEITIPLFEEEYPDIKVNVQAFAQDKYPDKLASALIAGVGPDVAMVEINNVIQFKAMELFEDLSKEPYNAGELEDQYVSYFWEYVTGEDGYLFALPKNTGPAAMFYNKKIFEAAGLPTEPEKVHELTETWDDFVKLSEKLTIPDKQWMVATPYKIRDAVIQQAGTSYFNENGELQIDNEHFMYAYETVGKLDEIGAISPYEEWSPEWNATIQNGTVATYLYGNWFGKFLKNNAEGTDGEWGVTYAPAYEGQSAYDNGGDFIGILKTSENKDAAWKFTKFVTQNMDNLKGMYEKDELYPAYTEALEQDWMNNENEFFGGQVTNEVFKNVAQDMEAPFVTENDPIAVDGVKNLLINITLGDMSLEDALKQSMEEINARVK